MKDNGLTRAFRNNNKILESNVDWEDQLTPAQRIVQQYRVCNNEWVCLGNHSTNWTAARSGTGTFATYSYPLLGFTFASGTTYFNFQLFIGFNTAQLAGREIITVCLILRFKGMFDAFANSQASYSAYVFDWGGTAQNWIFRTPGQLSSLVKVAEAKVIRPSTTAEMGYSVTDGACVVFGETNAFKNQINKTGQTRLVLADDLLLMNVAPTNHTRLGAAIVGANAELVILAR